MQFEAPLEIVLEREHQRIIFIATMAVRVAISDIVRFTGIDGVLMPNVSNSFEQYHVRMEELEVG
jgi:hypothetical protein